jgi:hypothetical protein
VQVNAAASIIETDTASQGTVIDNQRIVELPLNGRNFENLQHRVRAQRLAGFEDEPLRLARLESLRLHAQVVNPDRQRRKRIDAGCCWWSVSPRRWRRESP